MRSTANQKRAGWLDDATPGSERDLALWVGLRPAAQLRSSMKAATFSRDSRQATLPFTSRILLCSVTFTMHLIERPHLSLETGSSLGMWDTKVRMEMFTF